MNGFAIQILKYLKFYADKMNSVHFPKKLYEKSRFRPNLL